MLFLATFSVSRRPIDGTKIEKYVACIGLITAFIHRGSFITGSNIPGLEGRPASWFQGLLLVSSMKGKGRSQGRKRPD